MNIAWKNIMARKWSSLKVVISIFIMLIIMCIFTAYSIALGEEREKVVYSFRSGHNFIISTKTQIVENKIETMKNMKGISNVVETANYRNLGNLRGMTFAIDANSDGDIAEEETYKCEHFYYDDDLYISSDYCVNNLHLGDFAFVKENQHLVLPQHNEELKYRFKDYSSLLAGRDVFNAPNEIVVSEYFLKEFGLDASIINKKMHITFQQRERNGEINEKTYTVVVVGVLNQYYYQLTNSYTQHFIANINSDFYRDFYKNQKSNITFTTKLYLENYMLSRSLMDDIKGLGFLKVSVGSQYGLSMATTVTIVSNILTGVMATVGVGIISALILNIIYSMRFMIMKKSNFYGIMQAYGLKKRGLFEILFCEMFILSIFAIVFAYAVSYGLVYLFDFLMSNMVGLGVFFGWQNFLITFAVAVCFTIIVVVCVSLINYLICSKKSMIKILKNSSEN